MAVSSNSTSLPVDNRPPHVRLTNDAADLARMASIVFSMLESAFCPTRAASYERGGTCTFHFQEPWLDDLHFAGADVLDRARSVAARLQAPDEAEDLDREASQQPKPSADFEVLTDLDGSLHVASSLLDALEEVSSKVDDPERRLASICAIVGHLTTELQIAKDATGLLLQSHGADISTG